MSLPAQPAHGTLAGVLMLIACAALWSLNGPLIKLLGQAHVPEISITCYRSLLGGFVLLPWALRRRRALLDAAPRWIIASVIVFTFMTASFVIATSRTAAANAIILQYTSAIWVFALSPLLLNERPQRTEGLILLVAMLGVIVLFAGNPGGHLVGLLVALLSGLGYGLVTIILRALRSVSPIVVATLNALGSGLVLLVPALIWGRFELTPASVGLLVLMAIVQFTVPYFMFSWALQRVEAHRAALILLLEVILNPIWTYFAVREVPPVATLIGGLLVLAGVAGSVVMAWRRERERVAGTLAPPP